MFQKKQRGVEFGLFRNNPTHRAPQILHSHKHTAEIFFFLRRLGPLPLLQPTTGGRKRGRVWACVRGEWGGRTGGNKGGGGTVAAGEMV